MIPRDYQLAAVQAPFDYYQKAHGHIVLELPTGSGKSLVQALFIQRILQDAPGHRVLCLTHVRELVEQNHDELMAVWPCAPAGIYSAGLGRRDTREPVIFASIQSVHKRAKELGKFAVVFVDECHLVPSNGSTMYRTFIDALTQINPQLKVVGLSATPYRLNGGLLTHGENALFDDIVSAKKLGCTLSRLIELGHLAPMITPKDALPQLSTEGVGKSGGDYKPAQLASAIEAQRDITELACAEIVRLGADRGCWIIFCASVAHCHQVEQILAFDHEIDCAVVVGETAKADRDDAVDDLRSGVLQCLISVNVLSTGFNVKQIDLLAMLRPTDSCSLYVQQVGRGMRVADGKDNCLVLDFAGNIAKHGPIDNVKIPKPPRSKGGGDAVQKECPTCVMLIFAGCLTCPFCGHEFPRPEIDISHKPSTQNIIGKADPVEYRPTKAVYGVHKKPGKPHSLRVSYYVGLKAVGSLWVCVEHDGFARTKAQQWWSDFMWCGMVDQASTAVELCRRFVPRLPSSILVDESGKFPMVKEARI